MKKRAIVAVKKKKKQVNSKTKGQCVVQKSTRNYKKLFNIFYYTIKKMRLLIIADVLGYMARDVHR